MSFKDPVSLRDRIARPCGLSTVEARFALAHVEIILSSNIPSDEPSLTPITPFLCGTLDTLQPLSCKLKISSQYVVSLWISFSSRVADAKIESMDLFTSLDFHPFATTLLSSFRSGVIHALLALVAPSVPKGMRSRNSGEMVWLTAAGFAFESSKETKLSELRAE